MTEYQILKNRKSACIRREESKFKKGLKYIVRREQRKHSTKDTNSLSNSLC